MLGELANIPVAVVPIVGGLLILTLSSFRPIIYFGLLVAFSLFATAVGTLVVLPAVLSIRQRLPAAKTAKSGDSDTSSNGLSGCSSLEAD